MNGLHRTRMNNNIKYVLGHGLSDSIIMTVVTNMHPKPDNLLQKNGVTIHFFAPFGPRKAQRKRIQNVGLSLWTLNKPYHPLQT